LGISVIKHTKIDLPKRSVGRLIGGAWSRSIAWPPDRGTKSADQLERGKAVSCGYLGGQGGSRYIGSHHRSPEPLRRRRSDGAWREAPASKGAAAPSPTGAKQGGCTVWREDSASKWCRALLRLGKREAMAVTRRGGKLRRTSSQLVQGLPARWLLGLLTADSYVSLSLSPTKHEATAAVRRGGKLRTIGGQLVQGRPSGCSTTSACSLSTGEWGGRRDGCTSC
ncbi:hypothetical protein Taro_033446, partial [Colocasia esculenta]|nr:hypothetical protein [Colocasia esculenta]